jgi:hypothetical protein
MVRKKNKRHIQSTPTELRELIDQGLIVDEINEVLE